MLTSVFTQRKGLSYSPFCLSTTIICGFFASCLRNKIFCNPLIFGDFAYPQILTGTEVGRKGIQRYCPKARKYYV